MSNYENPADEELTKQGEGVDEKDDPKVKQVVAFVRRAEQLRRDKQVICDAIDEVFEMQYNTTPISDTETQFHKGRLLHDTIWKVFPRTKPLDYILHNDRIAEPMVLRTVEAALSYQLTRGKYAESLREANGVYWDMFKYGDGLQKVTPTDGDSHALLSWEKIHVTKAWFDPACRDFHTISGQDEAGEFAYTFNMPLRKIWEDFPELKGKIAPGKIDLGSFTERNKELENTERQKAIEDRDCQIIVYFNKYRGDFIWIGGSTHTIMKNPKYPFKDMNKKNIIPVTARKCYPSSVSPYAHSLCSLFFREHIIERMMNNMAIIGGVNSMNPTKMVEVDNVADFNNKLLQAAQSQMMGRGSYIVNKRDGNGKPAFGQAQFLDPQGISQDYERLINQINERTKRSGINVFDISPESGSDTAKFHGQREAASNTLILEIMEQNMGNERFSIEMALMGMQLLGDENDDRPLNVAGVEDMGIDPKLITIGKVVKLLNDYDLSDFSIEMKVSSGATPSTESKIETETGILQYLIPGSKAWAKKIVNISELSNSPIKEEDLLPPAPPQQQGPPQGGQGIPQVAPQLATAQ